MFVRPEHAAPGVQRGPLLIAVAVGPDFRTHAVAPHEGIVVGHAAVQADAHHLALMLVEVLRGGALVVLAQRHEQMAVAIEDQPRAEMNAAGQLGQLAEDHLEVFQPGSIITEPAAADGRPGLAVLANLGVAQIDQAVLLERRRQPDIEQATLRAGEYVRHASQRFRSAAIEPHQPQPTGPLGHQHVLAIRKKGQPPRVLQPRGDLLDGYLPRLAGKALRFSGNLERSGNDETAERGANGMAQHEGPPVMGRCDSQIRRFIEDQSVGSVVAKTLQEMTDRKKLNKI